MLDPIIKVTRINDVWHSRLIYNHIVIDEMACECREDIGWICREMLRWFNKIGGYSKYADKARHRPSFKPSRIRGLNGKVWYKPALENIKRG